MGTHLPLVHEVPPSRAAGAGGGAAPPRARRRARQAEPPAAELPVARVAVDVPLAHLDRPFDYVVTASQAEAAVPGARVRVRFAGTDRDGWLLERAAGTAHDRPLEPLSRVVSAEPVLAPEVLRLAREVADRWVGTLPDVLRLAVPPRHRTVEAEPGAEALPFPAVPAPGPWADYPGGEDVLRALGRGPEAAPSRRGPRVAWTALPGDGWRQAVAVAVQAALAGGRGALVLVPDAHDLAAVDAALGNALGPGRHVALSADLGPAERYRRFLAVRRGTVRAVVGTRGAVWAPVQDLGLLVSWDDGDEAFAEPLAPYPHTREVLLLRAHQTGAAVVLGSHSRSTEVQALVAAGWARSVVAPRAAVRAAAPLVRVSGDDAERVRDPGATSARIPSVAWRAVKDGLERGPVLVQVPRAGYEPGLRCAGCAATARCPACAGPLGRAVAGGVPACRWCGRPAARWTCGACGEVRTSRTVVGVARTAEELGRAFPGVPVRASWGDHPAAAPEDGAPGPRESSARLRRGSRRAAAPRPTIGAGPALVVTTPGSEPPAVAGYAAAVLLDASLLLQRPDLRAEEEALRRWTAAAALVRPAAAGGVVVLVADASSRPAQALVRWDPVGAAERELADRTALRFPPAARVATLTASASAVADFLEAARLPASADVLGPVPVPPVAPGPLPVTGQSPQEVVRAIVRVPRRDGRALTDALRAVQGVRSARRADEHVRVQVDPVRLA